MRGCVASRIAALACTALAGSAHAKGCPQDSVLVGTVCIDRYEASVWSVAPTEKKLIKRIWKGKIGSADQLAAAIRHGAAGDDYGAGFPDHASGCTDHYAVSIAGVPPSRSLTWAQALAACRNSGKRLPTNAEWTAAALGTPDPGSDNGTTDCNVVDEPGPGDPTEPVATGSRPGCVSDAGAFDMVGNVGEIVAEWFDFAGGGVTFGDLGPSFGDDNVVVRAQATPPLLPAVIERGGDYASLGSAAASGVFATIATLDLTASGPGFRCARDL